MVTRHTGYCKMARAISLTAVDLCKYIRMLAEWCYGVYRPPQVYVGRMVLWCLQASSLCWQNGVIVSTGLMKFVCRMMFWTLYSVGRCGKRYPTVMGRSNHSLCLRVARHSLDLGVVYGRTVMVAGTVGLLYAYLR